MSEVGEDTNSKPNRIKPQIAIDALVSMMKDDRSGGYLINRSNLFGYELICDYLTATLPFKRHICENDRRKLVAQSLGDFSRVEAEKCTWEELKKLAALKQREFVRTRQKEFHVWTAWSVAPSAWTKKSIRTFSTKNRKSLIRFRHSASSTLDHSELQPGLRTLKLDQFPQGWLVIEHLVEARTPMEAQQASGSALNFYRGLLNYLNNWTTTHRYQSPVFLPLNAIRGSELTTIHDSKGKCTSRTFWYTQPFRSSSRWDCLSDRDKLTQLVGDADWIIKRLKKVNETYSSDIKGFFAAYAAAMDEADVNNAFFGLWALLERLAGLHLQGSVKYDLLIKRIQRLFEDQKQANAALELLRYRRNDWVHRTSASADANSLVWATHEFVVALFEFHIRNGHNFESMSEACEFLDVTANEDKLRRSMKHVRLKLKHLDADRQAREQQ